MGDHFLLINTLFYRFQAVLGELAWLALAHGNHTYN